MILKNVQIPKIVTVKKSTERFVIINLRMKAIKYPNVVDIIAKGEPLSIAACITSFLYLSLKITAKEVIKQ